MIRSILIGGALLGVSACSPQQCDPSQAGFLSGIGCEASGSYGVRHTDQQLTFAEQNTNALQSHMLARNESTRASQALLSRDQARQRLAVIDRQTAQLQSQLVKARARGGADRARLEQAQMELTRFQRQRASIQVDASEEQLRALDAQHKRTMDALAAI